MIPLSLTSSPSVSPLLKPSHPASLRHVQSRYNQLKKLRQKKLRDAKCRAEFSADAPVAVSIGAGILSSLIHPAAPSPEDSESESLIDSGDARFAVMGIISFIPYFNWMLGVCLVGYWKTPLCCLCYRLFIPLLEDKLLATKLYSKILNNPVMITLVYWVSLFRRDCAVEKMSNLSISPEDSWLPIASILLCIAHIQLESSIKNGDIQGLHVFNEAVKHLSSIKKHAGVSDEEEKEEDREILNEDEDGNGGAKH